MCLMRWGHQVSPRVWAWGAVPPWLSVMCISVALVLVTASPMQQPGGQQAARCRLSILGGADGRLQQASMSCTGPITATVYLNATYLASFQAKFTGVRLVTSCKSKLTDNAPCLIIICGGAVVLQDSNVSWVRGVPLKGLLCLVHDSRLEVYTSSFSNNDVRSLWIGDEASVVLHNSNLVNNRVRGSGGGLWVGGDARVHITDGSRVQQNAAGGPGGGVAVVGNASVIISGASSVHNNTVRDGGGGGVAVGDAASVIITGGSSVHNNTALRGTGGGVKVVDRAVLVFSNSSAYNNTADAGGGLAVWNSASVVITGGNKMHNNMAVNGNGGGVVLGGCAVVSFSNSSVYNNTALWSGGGVYAQDASKVTITNSSVHGNTARQNGGGLDGMNTTLWVITGGSSIHNNIAHQGGGGIFGQGASKVTITDSSVHGNTARRSGGGLLGMNATFWVITGGSSIHNNIAHRGGGGMFAQDASKVTIANSSINSNVARRYCGGGLAIKDATVLHITSSSSVHSNIALGGGGGICAGARATLTIVDHSTVHGNWAAASGGGLLVFLGVVLSISSQCSISNNSCTGGVGGGICAGVIDDALKFGGMGRLELDANPKLGSFADNVTISSSSISNNTNHHGAGGGLAVGSSSVVNLRDGSVFDGNRVINGSGGAVMLTDNAVFATDGTVVFVNNGVQPPNFVGSTIVAFGNSSLSLPVHGELTKCNTSVYLGRTPCGVGETLQHDVCICCPPHTYGFSNNSCTQCPPNAVCRGASIVEPLPGFWSSAPTSFQMHRCPLFTSACDYVNQTHLCRPGYQGPLCGACQLPDYGMLSPMRCGRCMPPSAQLALYMALSWVTVLFVAYTVHATWQDNLQGNRAVLVTDYIKVLVQFLQYIVIIGSVSVPWPLFDVQQWLQAIGILVTMGSGQALSVDCWLYVYSRHSALPIAIQRELIFFLAPMFTFMAVVALQCLLWAVQRWLLAPCCKPRGGARAQSPLLLLRTLPVTVLVLVYYAYPTLARASLSFFACLKVDEPITALRDVPQGATAPLTHPWGYWVSSIEQQCFAGYHLGWAMGLGLPSVLLWCVAVPVAMGVGLYLCRERADTDSFREHFGFLYRTYKPERMWWEAVWAARTVVLILISVFSFPMQRYFSVLSLLVAFWVSAALQIVFKPYAVATLHRMHLVSTACLAATTMGALAMFAYDIQESTAYALRIAITVLVFVINLVFAGWCLAKLAPALKQWCADSVAVSKAWVLGAVDCALRCAGHPTRRNMARVRHRHRMPPCFGKLCKQGII